MRIYVSLTQTFYLYETRWVFREFGWSIFTGVCISPNSNPSHPLGKINSKYTEPPCDALGLSMIGDEQTA